MATTAARKRETIKAEIERRGLTCVQQGKAWHVYGLDVDILTVDLAHIDSNSLAPYRPRKGYAQSRDEAM